MDVNTLMKLVLSSNATDALSKNTEASSEQVASILNSVMPMLLSGASAQATNKSTASAFANALQSHAGADTKDLARFLSGVDQADGAKIFQHLLGSNSASSIASAAKASGSSVKDVENVLSMVSPLLMSILGQQQKKHGNSSSGLLQSILGTASKSGIDAGDVIGILGKLLK